MGRTAARISLATIGALLAATVAGCGGAGPASEPSGETTGTSSSAAAEQLTMSKCTLCHSYQRVERANYDEQGWEETVDRMIGNGLVVTTDERAVIVEYLTATDR
jgi:hypothetical protein